MWLVQMLQFVTLNCRVTLSLVCSLFCPVPSTVKQDQKNPAQVKPNAGLEITMVLRIQINNETNYFAGSELITQIRIHPLVFTENCHQKFKKVINVGV